MICLQGTAVCGGKVSGTAYVRHRRAEQKARPAAGITEEASRLEQAIAGVREQLTHCAEQADDDTARDLYDIHRMMLEDEDVLTCLREAVREDGVTAEAAVSRTEQQFAQMFRETGDDYMIARIDDIRDVCGALTARLAPAASSEVPSEPFVLVADELLPGDLLSFDRRTLLGIVIGSGTVYSHTAILIKERGIPALICDVTAAETGMTVLLDADGGTVCFDPDDQTQAHWRERPSAAVPTASPFDTLPCRLYVNIAHPQEVSAELMTACDGIGLFRTEYLYVGQPHLPDEDTQYALYTDLLRKAGGKCVTVRTFDIGSDKTAAALPLEKEENPALGWRGLRVYSLYPEVFRTQIRALLRAAPHGDLRILYPMVTSGREVAALRQIAAQAAQELEAQGLPYRIPPQGAMIETPAAALLTEEIAETADFLSVGTNDLSQYTLAIDRQSGHLDRFADPRHKAVTELIRIAAEQAHQKGIDIGICGELASLPELVATWNDLGLDYLSVSPWIVRNLHDPAHKILSND